MAFTLAGLLGGSGVIPLRSEVYAAPVPRVTPAAGPAAGPASTAKPVADDGMVTIESDSQQADNATGVVTATGNVRISYPGRGMVATARQAQYYSREGRLVLSGDVDVIDGEGQRIRAERIIYRLDSERFVAEPQAGRQVTSRLRIRQQAGPPPGPARP